MTSIRPPGGPAVQAPPHRPGPRAPTATAPPVPRAPGPAPASLPVPVPPTAAETLRELVRILLAALVPSRPAEAGALDGRVGLPVPSAMIPRSGAAGSETEADGARAAIGIRVPSRGGSASTAAPGPGVADAVRRALEEDAPRMPAPLGAATQVVVATELARQVAASMAAAPTRPAGHAAPGVAGRSRAKGPPAPDSSGAPYRGVSRPALVLSVLLVLMLWFLL